MSCVLPDMVYNGLIPFSLRTSKVTSWIVSENSGSIHVKHASVRIVHATCAKEMNHPGWLSRQHPAPSYQIHSIERSRQLFQQPKQTRLRKVWCVKCSRQAVLLENAPSKLALRAVSLALQLQTLGCKCARLLPPRPADTTGATDAVILGGVNQRKSPFTSTPHTTV